MAEGHFRYVAISASGKRVQGVLPAASEQAAFEGLRRQGLTPTTLRAAKAKGQTVRGAALNDRDSAELLLSLADLLAAGADMRSALSVLGARDDKNRAQAVCRRLMEEISAGEALEAAFSHNLAPRHAFVSALIAAGELAGDLPAGLRRAGEMLESSIKLKEQLVGAVAYPAFVLFSTISAGAVILLFVVPSLEPLVDDASNAKASILTVLIGISRGLRENGPVFLGFGIFVGLVLLALGRAGLLRDIVDRVYLTGPAHRIAARLLYGSFSIALGSMLGAGTPTSDALRLAVRGVRSKLARSRLEDVAQSVRQGRSVSEALQVVAGFPPAIVRLTRVGEASGALGAMLARAGRLEEQAAIRQIEAGARVLGPALIVALGGLIGLMMGGLLSGVTEIGQHALG